MNSEVETITLNRKLTKKFCFPHTELCKQLPDVVLVQFIQNAFAGLDKVSGNFFFSF